MSFPKSSFTFEGLYMRVIVTLMFVFLWLQSAKLKNERKIIAQSFVNMILEVCPRN